MLGSRALSHQMKLYLALCLSWISALTLPTSLTLARKAQLCRPQFELLSHCACIPVTAVPVVELSFCAVLLGTYSKFLLASVGGSAHAFSMHALVYLKDPEGRCHKGGPGLWRPLQMPLS